MISRLLATGKDIPALSVERTPPEDPVHSPFRFHPSLRPLVWGGRGLADALGKALPGEGAFGESWEISDHASHQSVVADGPAAGRTLRDLMKADPSALLGTRHERF